MNRIGINLLYLLPGRVGGTETYAAGLLRELGRVDKDTEFIVFLNREASNWRLPVSANVRRVVCPVSGRNRAYRYYFEQIRLPGFLRKWQVDLVHSLGYVGPIFCSCPSVVTIPDLNYIDISNTLPLHRRLPLRVLSTRAARNANQVLTISHFSKERLCKILRLPANKVTVTHLGSYFGRIALDETEWKKLRRIYQINEPYIVAFGGGALHKNIPTFLDAFSKIHKRFSYALVLIGHVPTNVNISGIRQRLRTESELITTGYVPSEHVLQLLGHADLFVLPSLYEGFGLPVLEAQQANVAVACSKAASLPEIAGEGAILFDPNSIDDIASKITYCLSSAAVRAELRRKGRENLKRFSWEKTATETLDVYRRVLGCVHY